MVVAHDTIGQEIGKGSMVACYGYLDDDGYNIDPDLDRRKRGQVAHVEIVQIEPGGKSVLCSDGAVWMCSDLIRVDNPEVAGWNLIDLGCDSGHTELWTWGYRLKYNGYTGGRWLVLLPGRAPFDGYVIVNVPVPVQFYGWADG